MSYYNNTDTIKIDLHKNIKNDYYNFTKSTNFLNDGFDMAIWSMEYADNLSEQEKFIIIDKYGQNKLKSMLPKIAHLNSHHTYEDFVDAVGQKEADISNIAFIICHDILKDFK